MKHSRIALGVALLLAPVFLLAGIAGAQSFRSGDTSTLAAGQTVDGTLFATGKTVDIAGEVNGDLYCAGQNISVSGTIKGDVLCAGQTVNIRGTVEGDVRAAGQTVTLGGAIARNASLAAQQITLESGAQIGGDVTAAAEASIWNGRIGRDLILANASSTIAGTIGRNVNGTVEKLTIQDKASIQGNVKYQSENKAAINEQAQIGGTISQTTPPKEDRERGSGAKLFGISALYAFVSLMLIAMALALLLPRPLHYAADLALKNPVKPLLIGVAACVLMPIVIIALAVTVVGIPLAILIGLAWLVLVLFAGPVAGYFLGRVLLRRSTNPLLIMLAGSSLLIILYFIPFLNILTFFGVLFVGTGIILQSLIERTPKPAYDLAPRPAKPPKPAK